MKYLIKLSGDAIQDKAVLEKVSSLARASYLTIVHGAGTKISDVLDKAGITYTFSQEYGRLTPKKAMPIIEPLVKELNKQLVQELDSGFVCYDFTRIGAENVGDSYTGKVTYIPDDNLDRKVLPPLGINENGETLNPNADRIAIYLAKRFDRVLFVTKSLNGKGRSLKEKALQLQNVEILEAGQFGKL